MNESRIEIEKVEISDVARNRVSMPPSEAWLSYQYLPAVQKSGLLFPTRLVEVDGHEFRERTKFQAARDRQRDRATIAEGFRVVRFTGQEVYRDVRRRWGD